MDWEDEGFLLASRPHGERAAILDVFTATRGRHMGVLRGGGSRRMAPLLQPGTQLALRWQARLEEHLGNFSAEPLRSRAGAVLDDPPRLTGLASVCALLLFALPEREPHPALYARSLGLLDLLAAGAAGWPAAYLRWELHLLDETGFGLDLSTCAVTGATADLAFVSPRSGRAVSRAGAGAWSDRLLALPGFLAAGPTAEPAPAEIAQGLRLTGHFLQTRLAPALGDRPLPGARARLATLLAPGG